MKFILKLTLISCLSIHFAWARGEIIVDVELTAGSFQAKTSKVRGYVTKQGDKYISKRLKVSVDSLKTGIDMRDEHLHKRLHHKKHSKIEIVKAIGKGGKGVGIIEIKGIKKKFNFNYKIKGKSLTAKFNLSLADFKVEDIRYMGVGVEDKVSIQATVPLR